MVGVGVVSEDHTACLHNAVSQLSNLALHFLRTGNLASATASDLVNQGRYVQAVRT
jgi:hypothetical protein